MNTLFPILHARRASSMTAVIAFSNSDTTFIASDGQMTYPTGWKRNRFPKVFELPIAGQTSAVLARAGSEHGCEFLHENLEKAAKQFDPTRDSIRGMALEALTKTHREIMEGPAEDRIPRLDTSFLLSWFDSGRPTSAVLNLKQKQVVPSKSAYLAEGSAQSVANYILEKFDFAGMKRIEMAALACYTIAECKTADGYCTGEIQIAWLSEGRFRLMPKEWVERMEEAVKKTSRRIHAKLAKDISLRFSKAAKDFDLE